MKTEELILNADVDRDAKDYVLDPNKYYVINTDLETKRQLSLAMMIGFWRIKAVNDYQDWVKSKGLDRETVEYTQIEEIIKEQYGKGPLWKSEFSQGIVVRDKEEDVYSIILECSNRDVRVRHKQLAVFFGGTTRVLGGGQKCMN